MVSSPRIKLYQQEHLRLSVEETIPEIKSHSSTDISWAENGGKIQFADTALPYRDTGVMSPLMLLG